MGIPNDLYNFAALQYAKYSPTHMKEGRGSLNFRLVNMRDDIIMGFLRGGGSCHVTSAIIHVTCTCTSKILHLRF